MSSFLILLVVKLNRAINDPQIPELAYKTGSHLLPSLFDQDTDWYSFDLRDDLSLVYPDGKCYD